MARYLFLIAALCLGNLDTWAMIDAPDMASSCSIVYYPSGDPCFMGHTELELEGHSLNMIDGDPLITPFTRLVAKSMNNGQPFYRFVFDASDDQRERAWEAACDAIYLGTCSSKALYPLSVAGVCSVPFPIAISPLTSALYLIGSKQLGMNNIKKIEYYGNPSLMQSVIKMLPGVSFEAGLIMILWPKMVRELFNSVTNDEPESLAQNI